MNVVQELLNNRFLAVFCLIFCAFPFKKRDDGFDMLLATTGMALWGIILSRVFPHILLDISFSRETVVVWNSHAALWLALVLLPVLSYFPDYRQFAIPAIIAGYIADPEIFSQSLFVGGHLAFESSEGFLNVLVFLVPLLYFVKCRDEELFPLLICLQVLFLGVAPAFFLFLGSQIAKERCEMPLKMKIILSFIIAFGMEWAEFSGILRQWSTLGGSAVFAVGIILAGAMETRKTTSFE